MSDQEGFNNDPTKNDHIASQHDDNERRNSLLYNEIQPDVGEPQRKASIDDVISSIAKQSAYNTEDRILKKDGVDGSDGGKQGKSSQKEELIEKGEQNYESNEKNGKASLTDDSPETKEKENIQPIQFQEVHFDPENLPDFLSKISESEVLANSKDSMSKSTQSESDSVDADAGAKGDVSIDDTKNLNLKIQDRRKVDDVPAPIIDDKNKNELQGNIFGRTGDDTGRRIRDDAKPAEDQFTLESAETKQVKLYNESSYNSNHERLPWEVDDAQEHEEMPWEANDNDATLPWEQDVNKTGPEELLPENIEVQDLQEATESKVDPHSPLESNEKLQLKAIQQKSPYEGQSHTSTNQESNQLSWQHSTDIQEDRLPWENEAHNATTTNTVNIDALFDENDNIDNDFLAEIQQIPTETIKEPAVPLEASNSNEAIPKEIFEGQSEISIKRRSQIDTKLDNDFEDLTNAEDENNFITENDQPGNDSKPFELTGNENVKSKSLDFLDMDDEFLDEEASKGQPDSKNWVRNSYTPNQINGAKKSDEDHTKRLETGRKKNDAYDFPGLLVSQKIVPAARTVNKYAPSTSSLSPSIPSNNASVRSSTPQNSSSSTSHNPLSHSQPPQSHQAASEPPIPKSFFEELPVVLPKPARAARAAAPVKTFNQTTVQKSPSFKQPAINQTGPINPYARPAQGSAPVPIQNQQPVSNSADHIPSFGITTPGPTNSIKPISSYIPSSQANSAAPNQSTQTSQTEFDFSPSQGLQPFPSVHNSQQNQYFPIPHKLSNPNPSPNTINTNVTRTLGSNSATSPYVPNAGPYAPSNHKRTHSRASSLIGVKGKEVNPYAPALPTVPNPQAVIGQSGVAPPINNLSQGTLPHKSVISPQVQHLAVNTRTRGFSNPRTNIYSKAQPVPKLQDPNALLHRQFPIFNWSISQSVVYLIPNASTNTYSQNIGDVQIKNVTDTINDQSLASFPGPLSKLKSKKKDVEKWLESNVELLNQVYEFNSDELLLNQVLLSFIKFDGDIKSKDFAKSICSVLNPTVDYYTDVQTDLSGSLHVANACKLDTTGVNIVFNLIQAGNIEKALEYTISRGDWAISLVIASFSGSEKFSKIASDYARYTFPFQKSNIKVHHLMPMLLKIFAGNVQSVINDLNNVSAEGEWANIHWRDIVSSVLISGSVKTFEFLGEFGKFLLVSGNVSASEVCFILSGLPLSNLPSPTNGALFSVISSASIVYTEIYEYALSIMPNSMIPPTGLPHLLPLKLKHTSILADYGLFNEAQKYVDAINSMIKFYGKSPFVNPITIRGFQNLIMRLTESGTTDSGWFSGRISKVNLDKVWGQIDKFIGGDEAKPKNGENGVFSKFSPSVSRTASTLDFTALSNNYPQSSPQVHGNDHPKDSLGLINSASAPTTSSDNSLLGSNGPSHGRITNDTRGSIVPPPIVSQNSSTSVQKYSPSQQMIPKSSNTPSQHNKNQVTSHQYSNFQTISTPQSKYAPSNTSSQNLLSNDNNTATENVLLPPKMAQSRYSPMVPKANMSSSNYPYLTQSGQFSTSSIDSHVQNYASPLPNPSNQTPSSVKRPSIASVLSTENFGIPDTIRDQNHSPSIQSDISLEYQQELKSVPRKNRSLNVIENSSSITDSPERRRDNIEHIPETINESPELNELSNASKQDEVYNAEPESRNVDNLPTLDFSSAPLKSIAIQPSKASLAKKTSSRVNPYAPGNAITRSTTKKNKYSPSEGRSNNKYSTPSEVSVAQSDVVNEVSYSDIFNYADFENKEQESKGKEATTTEKTTEESILIKKQETVEQLITSDVERYNPPLATHFSPSSTNFAPPIKSSNTNIDDSFENDDANDLDNAQVHTPKLKKSLFLNNHQSPTNNERESMFNPYQADKEKRNSAFGIDSSFGEFPIPGSPDYTTRANSVIAGPAGIFSSRLSQSHQSALYQQYEVQDDTVKDYIPVVEEDEEGDDDEATKRERKQQEEEERKSKQKADEASINSQGAQRGGWFNWLNRDDGRPKPIRAKLGEKNKFYFSEEHKRWIDRTRPIEEQIKVDAPPPLPKTKKKVDLSGSNRPTPQGPPTPLGTKKGPSQTPSTTSILPRNDISTTKAHTNEVDIVNAELDTLLSLGGGSSIGGTRKSKRGPRRGYVNVMDQK